MHRSRTFDADEKKEKKYLYPPPAIWSSVTLVRHPTVVTEPENKNVKDLKDQDRFQKARREADRKDHPRVERAAGKAAQDFSPPAGRDDARNYEGRCEPPGNLCAPDVRDAGIQNQHRQGKERRTKPLHRQGMTMTKRKSQLPADASPSDGANETIVAFRKRKFSADELYDRLQAAGLSPEEADEMCNLEFGDPE